MEKKKPLKPRNVIETDGNLYYDEKAQAWSILRLKSALSKQFYQLKEKRSKFSYKLVYYQDIEELNKAMKEIKSGKEALPALLFFYKEG